PVEAAASINPLQTELPGGLSLHGQLLVEGGQGIIVEGGIAQTGGSITNDSGGEIGRHSGISRALIQTALTLSQSNQRQYVETGQQQHDQFKDHHYGEQRIGNEEVIDEASFS